MNINMRIESLLFLLMIYKIQNQIKNYFKNKNNKNKYKHKKKQLEDLSCLKSQLLNLMLENQNLNKQLKNDIKLHR